MSSFNQRQIIDFSLITLLMVCGLASIDIHLACMPEMMVAMHTNKYLMQHSFSLYFLGAVIGMMIYGPVSDRFGRKPAVLFGMTLACIDSFLTAINDQIYVFLALRFLMGLGSGTYILARVLVADITHGSRFIAATAYISLLILLGPMVAPMVGSYIQHWFSWQANFVFLGFLMLCFLCLWWWLFDQTHQSNHSKALSIRVVLKGHWFFCQRQLFMSVTLFGGIVTASSYVYWVCRVLFFMRNFI
ncbi:MFS transporter [Gammaproteobacteria bacterium]|nr:MFS transporter [Gammaproteobacteria bacterium]